MTHLILFDSDVRQHLLPLTFLRPVADLRVGILTIAQKWEMELGLKASFLTEDYLSEKFPMQHGDDNLLINGALLPNPDLVGMVSIMRQGQAFLFNGELMAARLSNKQVEYIMNDQEMGQLDGYELAEVPLTRINSLTDIFSKNDQALREDFERLTRGRTSQPISSTNTLIGPTDQIFLEEGAVMEACTINTQKGPVYIGRNALVMEGCLIRGPLALGEEAVLKMGAKIYGATTIGPSCKVGGEVNNVVFQANSNKGHEGYLGNSVIGEWCNIGADTNCSNLKNTYEEVKLWNYPAGGFVPTGLQFCGIIMGDHSKCGINTMFNTGTVVGVSCNIFGDGFPRNFIPSFTWGGPAGYSTYRTSKAFDTMERVMARRNIPFTAQDRLIMLRVFELSAASRPWDTTPKN